LVDNKNNIIEIGVVRGKGKRRRRRRRRGHKGNLEEKEEGHIWKCSVFHTNTQI
jgi:hypothetical protein